MDCIVCKHEQKKIFNYKSYDYYRCGSCGLISPDPIPDEKTIEEHYSIGFKEGNYLRLRQWETQYRHVYQTMAQFLQKGISPLGIDLKGASILDIGCFTGDFLQILNEYGADVYGVELQKKAVEIANQKLPGRIYEADIYNDVFPNLNFDIICMNGLIEHVIEPVKLLHRSFELLKPGGVLMIQTPNSGSVLSYVMRQYWPPVAPVEHIYLFSRKSMQFVLATCGFNELKYKPHIKLLPVDYVYNNLQMFGPDLQKLISPIYKPFQKLFSDFVLPFYGGEMLMLAKKPA